MPVVFGANNWSVAATPLDLITSALWEGGILQAGEIPNAEDTGWGLEKLQRLFDQWNARREIIFSRRFDLYNLTPNHAPHTIGPGGDFNVSLRPVRIVSASFVLNSGAQPVDLPIAIEDADWWASNRLKGMTGSVVNALYYDPATPLGNLNFWPISTLGNPVRLESWNSLPQAVDLVTPIGFATGYWDAVILTLALRLWPSYNRGIPLPPALVDQQKEAMKVILANNDRPPRISTRVGGVPGSSGAKPDWNFLTGLKEN